MLPHEAPIFPLRDENPTQGFPAVNILLILACGVVFFRELGADQAFVMKYALVPARLLHGGILPSVPESDIPAWATVVTSMFLHGGVGHLVGNLWFLWIFGDNVEDTFGHLGYLAFYFVTGIAAGLTHAYLNRDSGLPTLGASGAISGVLGAYMVLYPRIRIRTLLVLGFYIDIVRVPAFFFLGVWFLMQAGGGLVSGTAGGVAFAAHVGGFVTGAVLAFLLCGRPSEPPENSYDPRRIRRW